MIADICKGINMPDEVTEIIIKRSELIDFNAVSTHIDKLFYKETWNEGLAGLKAYFGTDKHGIGILTSMMYAAEMTLDKYRIAGIDIDIFNDTLGCFSRFVREYKECFGTYGFDREWWVPRELSMEEFRIGELEYEKVEREGRKMLSVHIPSDAVLTPEKCTESVTRMREFMKKYIPEYKFEEIICDSWLLAPNLKYVLNQDSRIMRFQAAFDIVKYRPMDMDFILWVYKISGDDFKLDENQKTIPKEMLIRLPEQTSLQRNLKEYLHDGGLIGCALGYLRDETFGLKR